MLCIAWASVAAPRSFCPFARLRCGASIAMFGTRVHALGKIKLEATVTLSAAINRLSRYELPSFVLCLLTEPWCGFMERSLHSLMLSWVLLQAKAVSLDGLWVHLAPEDADLRVFQAKAQQDEVTALRSHNNLNRDPNTVCV